MGKTYLIKSMQYGYVTYYGQHNDRHLLQFSKTGIPSRFTFTSESAFQLVDKTTGTKRCITRKTDSDTQLILTGNCTIDQWFYNATSGHLRDVKAPNREQECFSPWEYRERLPADLEFTPGLSACSKWNQVIIEARK